ncbi:Uncharacterized conserved protein YecE, DUF72 family [Devosia crocina]|uniref:Uncharacterized conserved protein YecE, DUF72 family n=1 Tax=Devosia crocina TaxID=429728 RepID=A0A1I7NR08_9HYPH|nr:DUF72 domain-containing protein [Devosia crocina]SFV37018.1 Uncharacterized conserved protein YecE, DUF72 family [Devosia crocina]
MSETGTIRTGTAGWVFAPWRGTFFPPGLVQKQELHYASRHLTSIEINATFRGRQKPESFSKWAAQTPQGFQFSVKGPQLVTHIKRLKNCTDALGSFLSSGPLALGNRLGPFVWQLPPNLAFDAEIFSAFLELLPHDLDAYLGLAQRSGGDDSELYLEPNGNTNFRHAIETRHASFDTAEVDTLLRKHNVARVIADTPDHPRWDLTADFAYCRLQGPARSDAQGYAAADLDNLAQTLDGWRKSGVDTYAYFVHEDKLHAPANALDLAARLDITPYT